MYLEKIKKTGDIKRVPEKDLPIAAQEIRSFLINSLSKTGGHLGPNLGAVELTIALHRFLKLPADKVIWDVGHQCYTHKILTGRKDEFEKLRQYGGISGFPKRSESDTDIFETGHASNSISAALGLARARDLAGGKEKIVCVIGDGALTGGEAYEALNNASKLDTNLIIILNDNNMSISEPTGGMSKYLDSIRTYQGYLDLKEDVYRSLTNSKHNKVIEGIRRAKNSVKQLFVPGMYFENLGLTYLGPVNGHDMKALEAALHDASKARRAVILHVVTKKGKGFAPAETHPARFHGTDPYHIENGVPIKRSKAAYHDIFSTVMCKMGERDEKVVAITAAMSDGTGLKRFANKFPERFFDVGIAEQHAVTFSAGLALGGYKPVFAVYSTFLQRAYDQLMEDVCLQNLPVVFAIDRAGLVGADGETHQGIFDLSYLSSIPNMSVMAPKNKWELSDMLKFALNMGAPVAIRYPRGEAYCGLEEVRELVEYGRAEIVYEESGILLFAIGSMVETAVCVRDMLKEKGHSCSLVNARFAAPFDKDCIKNMSENHSLIVTMEENVYSGGLGEKISTYVATENMSVKILNIAIPDKFVAHGKVDILKKELGIDAESVLSRIIEAV